MDSSSLEASPPVRGPEWEGSADFIRRFFRDLRDVHLNPARFFRTLETTGGVAAPLAFALAVSWFGAAAAFLWNSLSGHTFRRSLEHVFSFLQQYSDVDTASRELWMQKAQDSMIEWVMGIGVVLADPFFTLLGVLGTAAVSVVGARLLVPSEPGRVGAPVSFETATRVICYGMAPSVLLALPYVGGFVAKLYMLIVTVIGFREVYRVSTGRAFVITIFPKLLVVAVAMALGVFLVLLIIGLFSAALFR